MKQKSLYFLALIGFVGILSIIFRLFGISYTEAQQLNNGGVEFKEIKKLGVEIGLPKTNKDIILEREKEKNVGDVIWATYKDESDQKCNLGAYYRISKKFLNTKDAVQISDRVRGAVSSKNFFTARAKEFQNFFLIYEPTMKFCTTEYSALKEEKKMREQIWKSLALAETL